MQVIPLRPRLLLLALFPVLCLAATAPAASRPSTVAELLEDNGENLIRQMISQQGGAGSIETIDLFSGKSAVKIIPMQLYQRALPGWAYKITENPQVNEYRFIRFAWKAPGAKGIMLQLHDEKDWNIRFTAGADEPNWGSKFVAPKPPETWTVVTRDLFADFGQRTIQGIALTVFGQNPGYFDHIYFGRSIEELDAIDATGQSDGPPPQLKPEDLERLWSQLAGKDAPAAYLAFWTLVAAPKESVPFLRKILLWSTTPQATAEIKKWILDLESDQFLVRDQAFRSLEQHLEAALDQLKDELPHAPPESQLRIEQLLKSATAAAGKPLRAQQARQVLKNIDTPDAKSLLEDLSKANRDRPAPAR
jgi:hypothetical protein